MQNVRKYWWIAIVLLLIFLPWSGFNTLVALDEEINGAWAQVENQLQRRFDLIPNLVETVKGYTTHEQEVLGAIAEARTRYTGASSVGEKAIASGELDTALSRLMVIVENYPQLKADTQFTRLQDELAGTENRIAVARMRYNEQVKAYNAKIRRVPYALYASLFGFSIRDYFEAAPGAAQVPEVKF